jgi:hypothetical protein
MVKDTCLDFSLTASQILRLRYLEGYQRSQRLNIAIGNKQYKQ